MRTIERVYVKAYEILLMSSTLLTLATGDSLIPIAACWITYHLSQLNTSKDE